MGKLDGRVAIITGASSGVGKGTAIKFAEEGAKVVIVGRNKERMQQTADECAKYNKQPSYGEFGYCPWSHCSL